ncbi:DUF726 domain-containing protein [Sphingobium sp.]|uniref:DUF726 domain-containing protein n=1 Tax=Sphingobium sp. TaxID=1912891 RepID=UPI0025798278|nr:DUF726 domain-containing protein [Sphingobium sp.]MBR2270644.1 alpha/beta fold hydrolase [Sphingobium sp.]
MRPRVEGQTIENADLSLRASGSNRLVVAPVATAAYYAARDRRILLLHGYNVKERDGQIAMAAMRHALGEGCPSLRSQILTVTWPGNESWWRGGAATYFSKVQVARATGERLRDAMVSDYALGLGSRELVIVAHSLGCRVTLEFLKRLDRASRPAMLEKVVVVLMAAAVPTHLDALFQSARDNADEIVILHSTDDWVLRSFFRVGQWLAGEGKLPEALGHAGNPRTPPWSFDQQMVGYGHGDYWTEAVTADVIGERLTSYFTDIDYRVPIGRTHRLAERPSLGQTGFLPEFGIGGL